MDALPDGDGNIIIFGVVVMLVFKSDRSNLHDTLLKKYGKPLLEIRTITVKFEFNGETQEHSFTVAASQVEPALAAEVHVCSHAIDERSVGDFESYGDKLEMLCVITLLATFVLGFVSSLAKPEEGSVLSVIASVLAIGCLLAPVVGAWYLHKQEGKTDDTESEKAREPNPLARLA